MSESKHTPGPWVANIPPTDRMAPTVDAVDGEVCTCECGVNRTNRHNARLIAAAPELLEVCEMGLTLFHVAEIAHAIQGQVGMEPKAQFAAAIAKAKPDG